MTGRRIPGGRQVRQVLAAGFAFGLVLLGCSGDGEAAQDGSSVRTSESGPPAETTRPAPSAGVPLVLASEKGVVVVARDGATTEVSKTPAAGAYGVTTDLVVFQDAKAAQHFLPPEPEVPVRVWSGGKVRALPADPKATRVELLDARFVDGVPTALVSERFDGVGPDDTFEELVRIDLRGDSRHTIVRRDGWESSHDAARLLPGGDVAGLFHSAADVFLARWSPKAKEALWTVELGTEVHADLSWLDGIIATVQSTFDADRRISTVVDVTRRDPATGAVKAAETVGIKDPDQTIDTGLMCRDWLAPTRLACGRSGGAPVGISLDDGAITPLPGEPGAIPMVVPS